MKEIRSIEESEFRIIPESRKIEGYALLFNTESQDLGGFKEVIVPESLNGVLEKSDVLALYNHEDDKVLARNTFGKGTLSLNIDEKGLKYSFNAPLTATGEEVFSAIQRGDLRNSSFAFTASESGQKWEKRSDGYLRTITQFEKLFDVSPVYRPAYLDTTVAARSLDKAKNNELGMEERKEIKVEVNVEICDENKNEIIEQPIEQIEQPTEQPTIDTEKINESELVDIIYDENTLTIPKYLKEQIDLLLEPYINDSNVRKLEQYYSQIEMDIVKLKK